MPRGKGYSRDDLLKALDVQQNKFNGEAKAKMKKMILKKKRKRNRNA